MATAKPVLIAARFATSGRVALGSSDNSALAINKATYPDIIISFLIDEEKGPWTATYRCDWKNTTDAGSFAPIAASGGEINWSSSTDLTNGGTVIVNERITTTSLPSGSSWEDQPGEVEGASTSSSFALSDERSVEVQFAISLLSAKENKRYDFQIYDATNGSAIGTASAYLTIAADQPSVVLNTADAQSFSDTTPTLEFTGTDASGSDIRYNIQVNNFNLFDTADQYTEGNYNAYLDLVSTAYTAAGQGFTAFATQITACKFYLAQVTSPTGSAYAKIYAHTGTFGTTGLPTGAPLATSNAYDVSGLTGSHQLITFTFDTPYTPAQGEQLFIVIEYSGANAIRVGIDSSSPTHNGNGARYSGSWTTVSYDFIFYITQNISLTLDKYSNTDAGFTNTVTPADTDPFNSGEKCDYTVQAALDPGTYYWRVRGMDPSPGSGSYGSWAATQSFSISTGGFNAKVMVDGVWKSATSGKVMVDGSWRNINSMKVMVNGAWKTV